MRIGINIPKELHQRLQPLKGTVNISEICREAIEARVKKYEEFVGWLDSDNAKQVVAEICEKELQRKSMVEIDWETIGYQDAKDWVQAATLPDWDYWNRCRNHPHSNSQDIVWVHGRHVRSGMTRGTFVSSGSAKSFHERHREYTALIHEQDDDFWEWMAEEYDGLGPFYDYAAAQQEYGRAWMAYTAAVWTMICERSEEYKRRWQHENMETRRSRQEPEVPEHLFPDAEPDETGQFRVVAHEGELVDGVDPLKLNRIADEPEVDSYLADGLRAP